MLNEEFEMDDVVGLEDPLDGFRAFARYSVNQSEYRSNLHEPIPLPIISEPPVTPVTNGRLCFVITKNKASSWAEDLSELVNVEERTRIYN